MLSDSLHLGRKKERKKERKEKKKERKKTEAQTDVALRVFIWAPDCMIV
jgi:hypothetical protein